MPWPIAPADEFMGVCISSAFLLVWHVDAHAHDPTEWKNNLYLFSQRIFR